MNNKPTKKYQTAIKQNLNRCKNIIPGESKWKYTNTNPTHPTFHATIKSHKQNTSIKPITGRMH
jgi:hypothetical protein